MYARLLAALAVCAVAIACGDDGPEMPGEPDVEYVNVGGRYAAQMAGPVKATTTRSCQETDLEERPAYVHGLTIGLEDTEPDPEVPERIFVSYEIATFYGYCHTRQLVWGTFLATGDSLMPQEWQVEEGIEAGAWLAAPGETFEAPVVRLLNGQVFRFDRVGDYPQVLTDFVAGR